MSFPSGFWTLKQRPVITCMQSNTGDCTCKITKVEEMSETHIKDEYCTCHSTIKEEASIKGEFCICQSTKNEKMEMHVKDEQQKKRGTQDKYAEGLMGNRTQGGR